jgi:hypothetical protein
MGRCHGNSIEFSILGRGRAAEFHIYRKIGTMKTTGKIPDALSRKAKATDAVREHLQREPRDAAKNNPPAPAPAPAPSPAPAPAWLSAFGGLRRLHNETSRVNRVLEQEFRQIEEEEWR